MEEGKALRVLLPVGKGPLANSRQRGQNFANGLSLELVQKGGVDFRLRQPGNLVGSGYRRQFVQGSLYGQSQSWVIMT